MKINEVEELLEIPRANIRYYEKENLIAPKQGENRYRDYSEEDIERLKEIIIFRKLGISIKNIKEIYAGEITLQTAIGESKEAAKKESESLKAVIRLSDELTNKHVELDTFDTEYYWEKIRSDEKQGNRYLSVYKDYLLDKVSDITEKKFTKERIVKAIPMIILLISPYLYLLTFATIVLLEKTTDMDIQIDISSYAILVVFVFIPNIVYAFILRKFGYTDRQLAFWNMLLKICNIPVYIMVFVWGVLLALSFLGLIYSPVLVLFDYLLLLPTTAYGISSLMVSRKTRSISRKYFWVNFILQFLFCTDVASAIFIYFMAVRREHNEG